MNGFFFPLGIGAGEIGLVTAVLIGFGFGFVLERAGFGRADKLAAQFYLHDMTVFKVMFTAIVTAMLGLVVAGELGLANVAELSRAIASETFLWPMLAGGFLLGMGFIISGYCPGTSVVATASGHLDGVMTVAGVVAGSLIYGEIQPAAAAFHTSGARGSLYLYELAGVPAWVVALAVTAMAIGLFFGAEKVEKIFRAKRAVSAERPEDVRAERRTMRRAFGTLGAAAAMMLTAAALPVSATTAPAKTAEPIAAHALAARLLDEPWNLRVLDVRDREACAEARVPGAECVPADDLAGLGLRYAAGARDLAIVGGEDESVPAEALAYPGKVYRLDGGFAAWKAYALTAPEIPEADAGADAREDYKLRAAIHAALTGAAAAAPPPAPAQVYVPSAPKKKAGGCS
ncbi:MAG: YeeE/YedE thiosulfate transporter family protein [Deltaproteobacteria bacterium]|nr:YeeE/YedE thiosulfate transporter family protein [Deltaproteobacteria bacterium]